METGSRLIYQKNQAHGGQSDPENIIFKSAYKTSNRRKHEILSDNQNVPGRKPTMLLMRCLHRAEGMRPALTRIPGIPRFAALHRRPRGRGLPRGTRIRDPSKKCRDAVETQLDPGGWRVEMTNIVAISHHRAAIIPLEDAH